MEEQTNSNNNNNNNNLHIKRKYNRRDVQNRDTKFVCRFDTNQFDTLNSSNVLPVVIQEISPFFLSLVFSTVFNCCFCRY